MVTQKFEPSDFESGFSALAHDIAIAESLDSVQFVDTLRDSDKNDVFHDHNFIDHMKQATIRENGKAKRFLLGLVHHQQDGLNIISEHRYSVEHVLPTSPQHLEGWPNFDERGHKDNVHLIGNLALLSEADNKPGAAFNRSFERKKSILENSLIELSKDIAQITDWSPAAIQERQLELVQLASQVWDFPEEFLKR